VIELLGAGSIIVIFGLVLWAALRSERSAGAADTRAEEAQHAVENAERITAAVESAPRTVGDVADRVRRGNPL
jgi:hypothetical protein